MRIIFSALIFVFFIPFAYADATNDAIRTYNSAKQSGDAAVSIKAAIGLGEAAINDPGRSDQATLVYEAAQSLVIDGANEQAAKFASWLEDNRSPEMSSAVASDIALLNAYLRWLDKPNNRNRRTLDDAMEAMLPEHANMVSVAAFQARYVSDMQRKKWRAARRSAEAAATYMEPIKSVIGEQWSYAVIYANSSRFYYAQNEEPMFNMARHQAALERIHWEWHEVSDEHPEWINKHRYLAEAWWKAMEAYLESDAPLSRAKIQERKDQVTEILNWYERFEASGEMEELKKHYANPDRPLDDDSATEQLPLCDGEFDMEPKLEYPEDAAEDGLVGAVIISLDLKDGRVAHIKTLAEVPTEGFSKDMIKTIKKWTWKTEDEGLGETCSLDAQGITWPFTFALR